MSIAANEFDPRKYMTKISGSDYLAVKWRLLWLRSEHPDAVIETELHKHDAQSAVFRARVTLADGGSSTGWGSEQLSDFHDYIEKAETKALGRALAALGFGTQFCSDFEDGSSQNRPVDSPINFQSQVDRRRDPSAPAATVVDQPATPKQINFITAIALELNLNDEQLHLESQSSFGCDVAALSRRDASIFIDRLQQRRSERVHATA